MGKAIATQVQEAHRIWQPQQGKTTQNKRTKKQR